MRLYQIENTKSSKADPAERVEYERLCQSCGACCSYYAYWPKRIPVKDGPLVGNTEFTFFGVNVAKFVWPDGASHVERNEGYWMRRKLEDGWWKCKALTGSIGRSVSCSVYESRPSTCSGFDPGSDACKRAREWAGLPPRLIKTDEVIKSKTSETAEQETRAAQAGS